MEALIGFLLLTYVKTFWVCITGSSYSAFFVVLCSPDCPVQLSVRLNKQYGFDLFYVSLYLDDRF